MSVRTPTELVPGLWSLSFGFVNAYLLADGAAPDAPLTLIDTGLPNSTRRIVDALGALGRRPTDVRWIIATHLHADHTGSLAALARLTKAEVLMHPADAALVAVGDAARPMQPAPTLTSRLFTFAFNRRAAHVEPCRADRALADEEKLPCGGGLRVVYAPGHTAGHVALLWPKHGGVLIAADACANFRGRLGWSVGYEQLDQGVATLDRLAALTFDTAVFGHGRPLTGQADRQLRHAVATTFQTPT